MSVVIQHVARKAVRAAARLAGFDLVRWCPGFVAVPTPLFGDEFSPLRFAVPSMLADSPAFFFIQVGANDGIRADHLRPLILKYHLRGLLVEPLADMFGELRENYAGEPQLAFANVAISTRNEVVSLFRFRADAPVPDWAHGMATFNEAKIRGLARHWDVDRWVNEERVQGVTFDQLVGQHQIDAITLLQVDTEGFDLEVIRMALGSGKLPALINFEHVNLSLSAQARK